MQIFNSVLHKQVQEIKNLFYYYLLFYLAIYLFIFVVFNYIFLNAIRNNYCTYKIYKCAHMDNK